ncbi:copper-transporting ATPase PAA2, chloroplastic, partial [Olea europaea subsp. europaea]
VRTVNRVFSKAIEFKAPELLQQVKPAEEELISTVLLDVSGMMCGACVTRVKSIIASDERVDSVVVNMLTERAAIKLKDGGEQSYPD